VTNLVERRFCAEIVDALRCEEFLIVSDSDRVDRASVLVESTQQSSCWLDLGWASRFYVLELLLVRLLNLGRHLVTGGIVIKLVNQVGLGTP